MDLSSLLEMYLQSLRVHPEDCGNTFQANYKCPYYSHYVTFTGFDANVSTVEPINQDT